MNKIISLDIDGVVNKYPASMFSFSLERYGIFAGSKDELKLKLQEINLNYEEFKYAYRLEYECIAKTTSKAEVREEFFELYEKLKSIFDMKIVFRTTRPEKIYPGTLYRTQQWLASQGIECVAVEIKDESSFCQYRPILHLDDELDHLNQHIAYVTRDRLILFNKNYDMSAINQFTTINNLNDLCQIIHQLN
jgi:hypothetical protein